MADTVGYATLSILVSASSAASAGNLAAPTGVDDLGEHGKRGGTAHGAGLLAGASRALAPLAVASAAIGGVIGVAHWGKAQVEALGRIEQINTQTASVIKSTGNAANVTAEGVEALAGKLEGLTGTEAESIQEGANLLLTFKNIRNEAGAGNDIFDQTTTAMVDMARAMGTDASSGAMQLGKALNDPVAGIAALSRVGITFSEDQKTLIKSLVESGQTMEAQKIILGELNSQFGGSGAAYAQTYAGKIDLLGHAWGTFGETLFTGVMPALGTAAVFLTRVTEVATGVIDILFNGNFDGGLFAALGTTEDSGIVDFLFNVRDLVIDLWSAIASGSPDGIAEVFTGLIEGAADAGAQVRAVLFDALPAVASTVLAIAPTLVDAGARVFGSLVDGVVQLLPYLTKAVLALLPALTGALDVAVPGLLNAALILFEGLVTAVTTALPLLVTALIDLLPAVTGALVGMLPLLAEAALTLFMSLLTAFAGAHTAIIAATLDLLPMLVSAVIEMVPLLVGAAIELFLGIVLGLVDALPQIIRAVLELLPPLITALVGMLPVLVQAAVSLFQTLAETVPGMLPEVVGALGGVSGAIVTVLGGLGGTLLQAGIDLVRGLVQGLMNAAGTVVDALLDVASGAVDAFKNFLGIHSPSRLFIGIGTGLGDQLAEQISEARYPVPEPLDPADIPEGGLIGEWQRRRQAAAEAEGDTFHIGDVRDGRATAAAIAARRNHAA
jgi:phage-related protein